MYKTHGRATKVLVQDRMNLTSVHVHAYNIDCRTISMVWTLANIPCWDRAHGFYA